MRKSSLCCVYKVDFTHKINNERSVEGLACPMNSAHASAFSDYHLSSSSGFFCWLSMALPIPELPLSPTMLCFTWIFPAFSLLSIPVLGMIHSLPFSGKENFLVTNRVMEENGPSKTVWRSPNTFCIAHYILIALLATGDCFLGF